MVIQTPLDGNLYNSETRPIPITQNQKLLVVFKDICSDFISLYDLTGQLVKTDVKMSQTHSQRSTRTQSSDNDNNFVTTKCYNSSRENVVPIKTIAHLELNRNKINVQHQKKSGPSKNKSNASEIVLDRNGNCVTENTFCSLNLSNVVQDVVCSHCNLVKKGDYQAETSRGKSNLEYNVGDGQDKCRCANLKYCKCAREAEHPCGMNDSASFLWRLQFSRWLGWNVRRRKGNLQNLYKKYERIWKKNSDLSKTKSPLPPIRTAPLETYHHTAHYPLQQSQPQPARDHYLHQRVNRPPLLNLSSNPPSTRTGCGNCCFPQKSRCRTRRCHRCMSTCCKLCRVLCCDPRHHKQHQFASVDGEDSNNIIRGLSLTQVERNHLQQLFDTPCSSVQFSECNCAVEDPEVKRHSTAAHYFAHQGLRQVDHCEKCWIRDSETSSSSVCTRVSREPLHKKSAASSLQYLSYRMQSVVTDYDDDCCCQCCNPETIPVECQTESMPIITNITQTEAGPRKCRPCCKCCKCNKNGGRCSMNCPKHIKPASCNKSCGKKGQATSVATASSGKGGMGHHDRCCNKCESHIRISGGANEVHWCSSCKDIAKNMRNNGKRNSPFGRQMVRFWGIKKPDRLESDCYNCNHERERPSLYPRFKKVHMNDKFEKRKHRNVRIEPVAPVKQHKDYHPRDLKKRKRKLHNTGKIPQKTLIYKSHSIQCTPITIEQGTSCLTDFQQMLVNDKYVHYSKSPIKSDKYRNISMETTGTFKSPITGKVYNLKPDKIKIDYGRKVIKVIPSMLGVNDVIEEESFEKGDKKITRHSGAIFNAIWDTITGNNTPENVNYKLNDGNSMYFKSDSKLKLKLTNVTITENGRGESNLLKSTNKKLIVQDKTIFFKEPNRENTFTNIGDKAQSNCGTMSLHSLKSNSFKLLHNIETKTILKRRNRPIILRAFTKLDSYKSLRKIASLNKTEINTCNDLINRNDFSNTSILNNDDPIITFENNSFDHKSICNKNVSSPNLIDFSETESNVSNQLESKDFLVRNLPCFSHMISDTYALLKILENNCPLNNSNLVTMMDNIQIS